MEIVFAHSMALMILRLVMCSICDWKELLHIKLKSLSALNLKKLVENYAMRN